MANELETPTDASTIRMLSRLLEEGGPAGPAPGSWSLPGGGRLMSSTEQLSPSLDERQPRRRTKTISERIERLEAGIRTRVEAMPPEERPDEEQFREVVANARSGLEKGESGEEDKITQAEAISLELVIETDGTRPSLFVANGFIDLDHEEVQDWRRLLQKGEAGLRKVIAAVGGIQKNPDSKAPYGTVFVIGRNSDSGLVITNRHVIEDIFKFGNGAWELKDNLDPVIDFVGEDGSSSTKFKVKGVRFAGPDANKESGLKVLDLAVLEVDLKSDNNFPEAVKFEGQAVPQKRNLCVIGFPARPKDLDEDIRKIFRAIFGVKRLAPGEVDLAMGQHKDDLKKWVFTHDATTLGGNSGSCVVNLGDEGTPVIGIHFGARRRTENYAHAAAAAAVQKELRAQGAVFV